MDHDMCNQIDLQMWWLNFLWINFCLFYGKKEPLIFGPPPIGLTLTGQPPFWLLSFGLGRQHRGLKLEFKSSKCLNKQTYNCTIYFIDRVLWKLWKSLIWNPVIPAVPSWMQSRWFANVISWFIYEAMRVCSA